VVLTHPDTDHITGLIEVLHRYRVKQVLLPTLEYESVLCAQWASLIEAKGTGQTIARAGRWQVNVTKSTHSPGRAECNHDELG
jgi:competence protein ComEC